MDGFTHCLKDNGIELKGPWAENRAPVLERTFPNEWIELRAVIRRGESVVIAGRKYGAAIKPVKATKRRGRPHAAA